MTQKRGRELRENITAQLIENSKGRDKELPLLQILAAAGRERSRAAVSNRVCVGVAPELRFQLNRSSILTRRLIPKVQRIVVNRRSTADEFAGGRMS